MLAFLLIVLILSAGTSGFVLGQNIGYFAGKAEVSHHVRGEPP